MMETTKVRTKKRRAEGQKKTLNNAGHPSNLVRHEVFNPSLTTKVQ